MSRLLPAGQCSRFASAALPVLHNEVRDVKPTGFQSRRFRIRGDRFLLLSLFVASAKENSGAARQRAHAS